MASKESVSLFVLLGMSAAFVLLVSQNCAGGIVRTSSPASDVFVEHDQREFHENEKITTTITNNLDTNITTVDQQAFCSIVRLQIKIQEDWKEVRNCFSGAPSSEVTLGAHSQTIIEWPGLEPGEYRASLVFSLGDRFDIGESYTSFSLPFTVQPGGG